MSYSDKLKDPRWQKLRLQVLERDEWRCQLCFDDKNMLAVHHRYYERGREPWDYPLTAFATLCQACHESEHVAIEEAGRALVSALRKSGALSDDVFAIVGFFDDKNPLSSDDGGIWPKPLSRKEWAEALVKIRGDLSKVYGAK